MKTIKISMLILISFGFIQTSTQAQSCGSLTSVVADIWSSNAGVLKKLGCGTTAVITKNASIYVQCLEQANKVDDYVNEMISEWNKNTDGWAKIGPRQLNYDVTSKGTLQSTGGRFFSTPYPALDDTYTLTINELSGKGKTSVVICKYDSFNNPTKLNTLWFNDSKSDKNNTKERKVIKLKGVKGYTITAHFDNKSVANKFEYNITLVE